MHRGWNHQFVLSGSQTLRSRRAILPSFYGTSSCRRHTFLTCPPPKYTTLGANIFSCPVGCGLPAPLETPPDATGSKWSIFH